MVMKSHLQNRNHYNISLINFYSLNYVDVKPMKRSTKQLLKRLLPVIALFLAINIGFGIEYYTRVPKEWYTATSVGEYNADNSYGYAIKIYCSKNCIYYCWG